MKKFILAILAVGAVATAQAQKPGSILIYGDAGFSTNKTTDDNGLIPSSESINKSNVWNVSPGVGYQFNRMLTAGLRMNLSGHKTSSELSGTTNETKYNDLEAGAFVRMTMPINKIFFVFDQLNVSYLHGKRTTSVSLLPDAEDKYNGFAAEWYPAVGVNFTHCLALNFSFGGIGYAQKNWEMYGPGTQKTSDFDISFGKTFNIGISANLGGRRMKGHMEPGMDRRHMDTNDDEDSSKSSSDVDE